MEAGAVNGAEAPDRDRHALIRPSNCRRPTAGDPASSRRNTDRFSHILKTAPTNSAASAIINPNTYDLGTLPTLHSN
jgi:hypothetical protein